MTITKENLKKLRPVSKASRIMWSILAAIGGVGLLASILTFNWGYFTVSILFNILIFLLWFANVCEIEGDF